MNSKGLPFDIRVPLDEMNPRRRYSWGQWKVKAIHEIYKGEKVRPTARKCGISEKGFRDAYATDSIFRQYVQMARQMAKTRQDLPGTAIVELEGFIGFRRHYFDFETYLHQLKIVDAIENTPPGGVAMILVPPEFGKTSVIEDYCNYRIGIDPDVRITVVSEGQPHARKILNRIKRRMIDPRISARYITDYGPFYSDKHRIEGRPWSSDFLTVAKSSHDERDYTVEARGWRAAIAGTRTDLLIVDDIQSRRSLNQTETMLETFRQDFLTRPGKEGRTIIVGTRVGIDDFYEAAMLAGIVDELVELPAIDSDGKSLCPEMWPDTALTSKRRKVGEETWWRNYMQQPRKAGNQTFTTEMVEASFDMGRTLGEVRHGLTKVCGLDPSIKGRNALVVASYSTDRFEVLDAYAEPDLGSTEAILSRVEAAAALHHFDTLVVEINAFQRGLVEDQRLRALSREHGFRIVPHLTGRNKLDEDLGVARMPTSFVQGHMSLPYRDAESIRRMDFLAEELYNWRPHISGTRLRQDLVMALWFCWLQWQAHRQSYIRRGAPGVSGVKRRHRLPYRPTSLPARSTS